jgi:soluble cytochrome b562
MSQSIQQDEKQDEEKASKDFDDFDEGIHEIVEEYDDSQASGSDSGNSDEAVSHNVRFVGSRGSQ